MQTIETTVHSKILGAASYTPVECLKGDTRVSSLEGSINRWYRNKLNQLQTIETAVHRIILEAARYTPVECLRENTGVLSMERSINR